LCFYIAAFYFDEAAINEDLDQLGTINWLLGLALCAYLFAIEKPLNYCHTPCPVY